MRQRILVTALGAGALAVAGLTAPTGAFAAPVTPYTAGKHAAQVCSAAKAKHTASCHAIKLVASNGVTPAATAPPATGLTPTGLRNAYKLNGLSAAGRTVAIVDAYGYPSLERDLGVYRSQFGLSACTTANGCLRIINQTGGTTLPTFNAGWAGEQALDVDAVSAAAPDAKILVVQAKSASFADLGTAVQTAAKQAGVVAISNSYGGGDASDSDYGTYYNHPGIAVTASTGDDGYQGGSYPASSSYTTAVGGTSLCCRQQHSRLERDRLGRRRLRLLDVQHRVERGLVVRHRLLEAGHGRRGRGGRPEQGRDGGLLPDHQDRLDLGTVRRDQRGRADHRRGLRAVRQHRRLRERAALRTPGLAVRRDERQQRQLPDHPVVQRPHRLGRTDRTGYAERSRRVLTTP